ncbi:MAG: aquaporin [Lewinellaceae bacterium]|nr:aquaporin [Lewinellaceae bacterium]
MQKYLAESIGTFALVFCGTGAIVINQESGGAISHVGVAMTFGLIILVMIYTFGEISGAHFNPAVTIGFWALRLFPGKEVAPYLFSQTAGAILASFSLRLLFPASKNLGATLPAGTDWQSFVLEFILTFLLMLVIIRVSQGARETGWFAGIAIGSMVGLEALFAGPVCGASMNPVRSLAPALVSGNMSQVWIYLIAPISGALTAVLCGKMFIKKAPF